MPIFFSSGGKILVQLFIKKKKKKFTTDINQFSQLEMALQLPLNEISQPKLPRKRIGSCHYKQKHKISTASPTLLLTTQTLKEPDTLYRSSVGFEKAHGCGWVFCFFFYILEILPPPLCFCCRDDICDYQYRQEGCSN